MATGEEREGPEDPARLRRAAEEGDAGAQVRLARMLLNGEGVVRDPRQACDWLRRAAEQGDGGAQAELGFLYEKGVGVEADLQQALAWYERSAAQSHPLGLVRMGDLYLAGLGIDQSYRKAFARYLQAAEQTRDPRSAALALVRLGDIHCQGRGVQKNLRQGFAFYLKAAQQGHAEAQRRVGAMYRDGQGVARDHKKAQYWLQKSTGKSGAQADSALGDLYRDGRVVAQDLEMALKHYERAAAGGDAYAKGEWLKLRQKRGGAATRPLPAAARRDAAKAGPAPETNVAPAAAAGTDAKLPPGGAARNKRVAPPEARPACTPGRRLLKPFLLPAVGSLLLLIALLAVKLPRGQGSGPAPAVVLPPAGAYAPPKPQVPGPPPDELLPPPVEVKPRPGERKSQTQAPSTPAAAVAGAPAPPPLRSAPGVLDEKELAEALAAKGLYDALRNPAGGRRPEFEERPSSGLALVADPASGLVWTKRPHAVKMSLSRSRQWIESLNRIRYGGIGTWRLPTAEEAATLLRPPAGLPSRYLAEPFSADAAAVWTADRLSESESWIVDFQAGSLRPSRTRARLATWMVSSLPLLKP